MKTKILLLLKRCVINFIFFTFAYFFGISFGNLAILNSPFLTISITIFILAIILMVRKVPLVLIINGEIVLLMSGIMLGIVQANYTFQLIELGKLSESWKDIIMLSKKLEYVSTASIILFFRVLYILKS